jgi:hypothetical protein
MRIRAAALALALASSSTALAGTAEDPILGGTKATNGQFPTVVAISLGGGLCTGTLISPSWVLTAGHCVTPSIVGEPDQASLTLHTTVIFDSASAFSGGTRVKAKLTVPHPGYNGGLDNDAGLIQLVTPQTGRTPIPLNRNAASAPATGLHLQMIGYGVSTSGDGNSAGIEYVLADKVTDTCGIVGDPGAKDANLLCWDQTNKTGKCEGDSGGPSFAMIGGKKTQVGITSVGWSSNQNQAACDGYGADTRVDHIMAWVDQTVGAEIQCAADSSCNKACGTGGKPVDPDCPTCTKDEDCTGTDQVCSAGLCVPMPFSPGGQGSVCTKDADCASGSCGTVGTDKKCTESCNPADSSTCGSGFDCLGAGTDGHCWPGAGAGGGDPGCCDSGGNNSAPSFFLLGLGALFFARRRRRA